MKRAEALRPLSREHLVALLTAKKLREATDADAAATTFLDFWRNDGQSHFRVEEEVLMEIWARHAEVDWPGTRRMLEEHATIRFEALRVAAGEVSLPQLHELGRLLHDHVRFEERQLFPIVEDTLDADSLAELAAAIEAAERQPSVAQP